jgi:PAS domain S-box-containing protein
MAATAESRAAHARANAATGSGGDPVPRLVSVTFVGMGTLLVADLAFLILRSSWQFSPWLDGWLVVLFEGAGAALCAASMVRRVLHPGVALLFGIACLSWTLGDLVITFQSLGGGTPPDVGLANAFWFGFYPFAFAALVRYMRAERRLGHVPNGLDGAIAGVGVAALCMAWADHSLDQYVGHVTLAGSVNLSYAFLDIVLLGVAGGTAVVVGGRNRATLTMIAVGLTVNAAGDTFAFTGAGGVGLVVNAIAWPISIYLIAVSMWVRESDSDRFALHALSGLVLPAIATVSSLVILVGASAFGIGPVAIGAATLALILLGIRLAFRPALRIAREQLRASQARYRTLFEGNPQPMVVYDRATLEIVDISDAMIQQYGYTREELCSMTVRDLQRPEEREHLSAYLAVGEPESAIEDTAEQRSYPATHVLTDGTLIDVEVTSTDLDVNGRACRIAHFDNVTERNRASRELAIARDHAVEASNMKSAFLANVSHEIRTPMNGVLGMNELLLDTDLDNDQRAFAEQVSRSGEQMLALINDILDVSKIEAGQLELDIADFDLPEAIEQACAVSSVQAATNGLEFVIDIGEEVPWRTRGDARRLRQIILNLVSNAVKFTAVGSVTVRASARPSDDGVITSVQVTDTGIGIDPAVLDHMFDPFTQADASTTRNYGGTGLGLAIVKELVELMGGTVGCESELGKGSTFYFELPLPDLVADGGESQNVEHEAVAAGWTRPPRILVAEDSPVNQVVALRTLERCGCDAEAVANGQLALDALERGHYDIVLMDCQMAVMDGYEATAEMRRREGDGPRTPVIAMTALAMQGDVERCIAAGMDDYVSKPIRRQQLIETLQRWIPAALEDEPAPGVALRSQAG